MIHNTSTATLLVLVSQLPAAQMQIFSRISKNFMALISQKIQ